MRVRRKKNFKHFTISYDMKHDLRLKPAQPSVRNLKATFLYRKPYKSAKPQPSKKNAVESSSLTVADRLAKP